MAILLTLAAESSTTILMEQDLFLGPTAPYSLDPDPVLEWPNPAGFSILPGGTENPAGLGRSWTGSRHPWCRSCSIPCSVLLYVKKKIQLYDMFHVNIKQDRTFI